MSMDAVRKAFTVAADGLARLTDASLSYKGEGQVLTLAGFHADGLPFAVTTEAFVGSPQIRAMDAARDIVRTHVGRPSPSPPTKDPAPIQALKKQIGMSQKGSGLARLVGGLKDFDSKADALATRLEAAMKRMETAMPTTEAIVGNVEKGASDLEAVNAQYSNGGPTTA